MRCSNGGGTRRDAGRERFVVRLAPWPAAVPALRALRALRAGAARRHQAPSTSERKWSPRASKSWYWS